MVELKQLFSKKEPTQDEYVERQQQYTKENIITENATHPQHNDEAWLNDAKERYADLRRWQQDLSPKFKEMFENLCGYRITPSGTMVPMKIINPIMNMNGAYHIVNFLKNLDVNLIMSNYEEYNIKKAMRHGVARPIIKMIGYNWVAFGMSKNTSHFSYVVNMAMNSSEPTFNRAWKGGEREVDSKIMRISRMENEGKKIEKKGIFS